ncbi:rhomboid-5 isoform X6 [Rhodnius prolixus]|uniref:rhomboid-5 isoform X6 n=1 Tax=Rhodnius prolixus TaxID=13249 RepID=UPI003D1897CE
MDKNVRRTVSQAPSPPSPSPSPPSQTTTSTPPSVLDSGVYSRSGPSSEAPSTCSTGAGSCIGSGGSPQVVTRSQGDDSSNDPVISEQQQHHQQRRIIQQAVDRQQSMPITQAELAASSQQRAFHRNNSWSEVVKQALKKNAAQFFGVDEATEEKEKHIWLGRRKRLASRRCGELKPEYRDTPSSSGPYQMHSTVQGLQPDILPSMAARDETDSRWHQEMANVRQKPSVASMTFKGVAFIAAALNKHRSRDSLARRRKSTRSYSPSTVGGASPQPHSPLDDEVFFDRSSGNETVIVPPAPPPADFTDSNSELLGPHTQERTRERHGSWKRAAGEGKREGSVTQIGLSRISSVDLDRAHDNSDRRQFGQGIIHRLFGRSLKRSVMSREPVKEVLEDLEDHRPFFTYWLSTVQILILVISLVSYGFGPFGMDLNHQSGLVLVTSLSLQQVDYTEPANFWIGPRAADLIHLGAKFAPCMRRDAKIMKEIEKGREKERETACCIRNDDSGCVQSSKSDCSVSTRSHLSRGLTPNQDTISTWKKWSHNEQRPGSGGGRISGSVCGLDPKYCEAPASVAPYEWPDDITKWPICRKTSSPVQRARPKDKLAAEHMVCEVIGHPCCIGIHATCSITTKEYCDFVNGHFHDEASLCSQVSCLDNVCGMLPFFNSEVPDQFYRLLTSLFLHAGIFHLAISLVIQWFVMRDVEKLTGTLRLIILYLGSGVAGNLASAIFVPYRADVGPAGANSGLLACLIVEILNMWPMLQHPYYALFKHLLIAVLLFIIGLLPWFDNFSSFFGFIFGFLLSYAILPYISVGEYERQKKIFLIWVCLITTVFLFLLLVIFFYIIPVYDCEICGYFNCLPLTRDFCSTQNINFKRNDGV